jgi:hypothetical protein
LKFLMVKVPFAGIVPRQVYTESARPTSVCAPASAGTTPTSERTAERDRIAQRIVFTR